MSMPDRVDDSAIVLAVYLVKSAWKISACRWLRASGGARCFGPTRAVGLLARGRFTGAWVTSRSHCQNVLIGGLLELSSSGWRLRVTAKRPRPGRPEAPNAPRCSRLTDRRGQARPVLLPISGEWCWLMASAGARRRARGSSRFRRPGPSQNPKAFSSRDGIRWHPSSLELAGSTRPDSASARQQPAPLAAGHLNSPYPSRWLSHLRNPFSICLSWLRWPLLFRCWLFSLLEGLSCVSC